MRAQQALASGLRRSHKSATWPPSWACEPPADSFVAVLTTWVTGTSSEFQLELGTPGAGNFWRGKAWYPTALLPPGEAVTQMSSLSEPLMSSAACNDPT